MMRPTPFQRKRARPQRLAQLLAPRHHAAEIVAPLLVFFLVASPTIAQSGDGASPQVAAARADAMEMLRQDVLAAHIQPDITVQMVVERTGGEAIFNKALASAHQVGG